MISSMMVHFYQKHFWLFIHNDVVIVIILICMAVGRLLSLAEPGEANLGVDRGVRMDP